MATKKPTSEELAKIELRAKISRNESIASVANNIVRWLGVGFLGYCMVLISREVAGQTTVAIVDFVARLHASEAVAAIFGLSGIGYGMRQRKLRRDTVERLSKRIADSEAVIDPQRTSSRLSSRGETPPEDPIR